MLHRRIEEVSLNSWPAHRQMLYDGWILRFTDGYSRRANSVNSYTDSRLDVEEKIAVCERRYAEEGLRTVFRITPFISPPDLDQVLEKRGYEKQAPTLVLHRGLDKQKLPPTANLRDEPLDDWMEIFCRLSEVSLGKHQAHKEILRAIPSRRFLASLADSGQVVACGVGVVETDYFGLFDLVTAPWCRNKGYGAQLLSGLLSWAQANGASHAYLQVMARNTPARRLYEGKLGFRPIYNYWYRISGD